MSEGVHDRGIHAKQKDAMEELFKAKPELFDEVTEMIEAGHHFVYGGDG